MSRNPEYQFVDTDTSTIEAELVAKYESLTGVTVQPASPEKLFIAWVASVIIQERVKLNYVGNQNLPSRAVGENLDGLAELFFLQKRPSAKPSTCQVKFTISEAQDSAVLVPAGTRVTNESSTMYWATESDEYIPAGDTEIVLGVSCMTSGSIGNGYVVGQICKVVDVFDYYDGCENITESANGSDVPTDDEFYEMLVSSSDAWSTAGPVGAYKYIAKSVSGSIADVVANSPKPGTVCIYAVMDDGSIAGEETKSAIVAACSDENVRPLTDLVTAGDAEEVTYDINITYYLTRDTEKSASAMEALVAQAVDEYKSWQSGKMGRDINPDKLRSLLLAVGVKRVDLTAPLFKSLRDGKPSTALANDPAPQIAKIGTVKVTNGGYEDE